MEDVRLGFPSQPDRFLGMELEVDDEEGATHVYIEEILRAYGISESQKDKIALGKDQESFEPIEDDPPSDQEMIAAAQRIAGEMM